MSHVYKKGLVLLTAMVMALGMMSAQAGERQPAKNGYYHQKVVYHINDVNKAKGALRNVKNHLNALGDKNVEIIVVTHSSGAFALVDGAKDKKGNTFSDQVAALANRGVKFEICANTIRGKKIDKHKISQYAKIVPSGVAQIAHLEQQGYLYIKP